MKVIRISTLCLLALTVFSCKPELPPIQSYSGDIRHNQLGYYPSANKKAVIVNEKATEFYLVRTNDKEVVYSNFLSDVREWDLAGETVRIADFSEYQKVGEYVLYVPDLGYSSPFEIKDNLYQDALTGSVRALYYQRASTDIPEQYGGKWQRAGGHPDERVTFHPSSGKGGFKASPKGWYDAGDFGKYVVNGAFPLGQLLLLAEQYPDLLADNSLNIPESGNGNNDFLDELKYEMDWLLSMQDEDGGMFFKLTTERFEGMIMPALAIQPRFIIGKGTAPSLDFAATAARAYRVFADYDSEYANQCLAAAISAWEWALNNPEVSYRNPDGIVTGEYGDSDFSQEFYWAAAELYISTQKAEFHNYLKSNPMEFDFRPGNSWSQFVHFLGAFTLMDLSEDADLKAEVSQKILATADKLVNKVAENDYMQPIEDFHWGSNSDMANAATIMAQAYRHKKDLKYLKAALETVDYIFGKNATGYSFVTGFGDKTPMFIHHRQSAADGIAEPVPGLLSGGPNSRRQDASDVDYPEDPAPMKSWVDQEPSYASNEICLNWNAPLTYILGYLEQQMSRNKD